ncbi:MAG: glycosyltransferase family 4 protein [Cyclobacterium sp.]|uniref:glycosyltransferase family 4 protein n=1 Tax=unclassified Cyclobacterium TaxID=2615055 RepID=UPI0013CFEC9D|nr:glycosyltransferase family 4 protein [Cyclobacterium sp. SYSU L10401]
MKCLLLHPTGNQFVIAILNALENEGLLAGFGTTISVNPNAHWLKLLPLPVKEELLRRAFPVGKDNVLTRPLLEIIRLASIKIGVNNFTAHEKGIASIDAVYQDFDRKSARDLLRLYKKKQIDAVYAYEDGALETFIQAKKIGVRCIYDLPIAYWETGQALMNEEVSRHPDWAVTLGGGINDSDRKLARKTKEMELADTIVCPGQFVMDTIPDWASNKQLLMVPFGSPETCFNGNNKKSATIKKRPLRVLFAGSMGQRKGLADLFEAMRLIKGSDIELVVMGALLAPMDFYKKRFAQFIYEPGRPHEQVLKLMRSCDIFCLPSIVEGRALVMQEAMSQGLPLIITPNTGGSDLIIEGKTGFLVPIRSPEKIAEKLLWFRDHRENIPEMGLMAQNHVAKYTWANYGSTIVNGLKRKTE